MTARAFPSYHRNRSLAAALQLSLLCAPCLAFVSTAPAWSQTAATTPDTKAGLLSHAEVEKLMPASVFFSGRSASVQLRNASGVRLQSGALILSGLVDTSGYSSGVQEKYQAYLLTETPLLFGSYTLAAGAYGVGFVGDHFLVMNIAGDTLTTASAARDAAIARPVPLQITHESSGGYRLYAGRSYVEFGTVGAHGTH